MGRRNASLIYDSREVHISPAGLRLGFFAICNEGIGLHKGNDFRPESKFRFTKGRLFLYLKSLEWYNELKTVNGGKSPNIYSRTKIPSDTVKKKLNSNLISRKYLPHPSFLELVLYDQHSTKISLPDKKKSF